MLRDPISRLLGGLVVVAAVGGVLLLPQVATGQSCGNVATDVSGPTIHPSALSDAACSTETGVADGWLAPGTFTKRGVYTTLHAESMTSGICHLRAMQYFPKVECVEYRQELFTINKVAVQEDPPTFLMTNLSIFALKPNGYIDFRQHLNTQDPGTTTGPIRANFSAEQGEWIYRFQTIANTTNCSIQPDRSEVKELLINVADCKPEWLDAGNPKVTPHAPPGEGMSLRLLKFSGGSVDDYAICRSS